MPTDTPETKPLIYRPARAFRVLDVGQTTGRKLIEDGELTS
jgi:hypothetical protein